MAGSDQGGVEVSSSVPEETVAEAPASDSPANGEKKQRPAHDDEGSKGRRRKNKSRNAGTSGRSRRRNTISKAARDPRDEPESAKARSPIVKSPKTRSPSPVIDFDGLSRPSMFFLQKSPRKVSNALVVRRYWHPRAIGRGP